MTLSLEFDMRWRLAKRKVQKALIALTGVYKTYGFVFSDGSTCTYSFLFNDKVDYWWWNKERGDLPLGLMFLAYIVVDLDDTKFVKNRVHGLNIRVDQETLELFQDCKHYQNLSTSDIQTLMAQIQQNRRKQAKKLTLNLEGEAS